MWSKDVRNFQDHAKDNLVKGNTVTGFAENFLASASNEVASGLSISRYLANEPIRERDSMLRGKAEKDPSLNQFMTLKQSESGYNEKSWDYDAMSEYLIAKGDEDVVPLTEIKERIQQGVKQADEYQKSVADQSSNWGTVGSFAGMMAVQAAEPVNYVSIIPALGPAASLATKVGAGMAANVVAESLVQPTLKTWKNENDIQYTDGDVAMSIGFSALFGGALAGLGHGISKMMGDLRGRNEQPDVTPDEFEANEAAVSRFDDLATEINGMKLLEGPDKDATAGDLIKNVDTRAEEIVAGRKPRTFSEADWAEPETGVADELAIEAALGIKREKPEKVEGVDVDPDELDIIEFDESKFDFEFDGEKAVDIIKNSDRDIQQMEKTIACMMGGGNA